MRVTDAMVERWLLWARNFGEVVSYRTGRGQARRFRVRVTPGVTITGDPFREKEGILDFFGAGPDDVVPSEMMLTAREALAFGMGCAVGRAAALAEPEDDWQRDRLREWDTERLNFARRRDEARAADREERDREAAERTAARERRAAAYRRDREAASRVLPPSP